MGVTAPDNLESRYAEMLAKQEEAGLRAAELNAKTAQVNEFLKAVNQAASVSV